MSLVSWYCFVNKLFIKVLSFLLYVLVPFKLLSIVSIYFNGILKASNSKNGFNSHMLWIYKILLSRGGESFLVNIISHHNIIGNLSECFPVNIFGVNFRYVATVSWDMTYLFLWNFHCLVFMLISWLVTAVAWNGIFYFSCVYHFKNLNICSV